MESKDKLFEALARLINAGADALQSYTKLQEKKAEYFDNAAQQFKEPEERPFEQYEPGYFEKKRQTAGPGT